MNTYNASVSAPNFGARPLDTMTAKGQQKIRKQFIDCLKRLQYVDSKDFPDSSENGLKIYRDFFRLSSPGVNGTGKPSTYNSKLIDVKPRANNNGFDISCTE
jgi:hypothetical protein